MIMILTLEGYLNFLHVFIFFFFFFFYNIIAIPHHSIIIDLFYRSPTTVAYILFIIPSKKARHIDEIAIWRSTSRILDLIILPIEWLLLEQTKDALDVFERNACSCNCNCKCNRIWFRLSKCYPFVSGQ